LTENPAPHKARPDTHRHHAENARDDAPTRLFLDPPEVLEIDMGRLAFSELSGCFTPEFREHMVNFRCRLNLSKLRTAFITWVWWDIHLKQQESTSSSS
jgi:hypothetical protein